MLGLEGILTANCDLGHSQHGHCVCRRINKQAAQHPKAAYGYIYINTLEKREGEGEGLYHCQECKGGKKREGWPQIRSSVGINAEAAPPIHSH